MPLLLDDYQAGALATAMYPKPFEVPVYPALGLNGEEGETAGVIVKLTWPLTEVDRVTVMKELGDQAWYLANLLNDMGEKMSRLSLGHNEIIAIQDLWFPWWTIPEEQDANFRRLPAQALALSAACGIVAEHVKKALRDDGQKLSPVRKGKLVDACIVVFDAWLELVSMLGFSGEWVLRGNLEKLASRKERGVLGGSGDNR